MLALLFHYAGKFGFVGTWYPQVYALCALKTTKASSQFRRRLSNYVCALKKLSKIRLNHKLQSTIAFLKVTLNLTGVLPVHLILGNTQTNCEEFYDDWCSVCPTWFSLANKNVGINISVALYLSIKVYQKTKSSRTNGNREKIYSCL